MASPNFGEYIIFVDESGDHGLTSINPENPVFVLVFCIIKKFDYISMVKPAITNLKFNFWGHDLAILHSHEIRRSKGEFSFLFNEENRKIFLHSLNQTLSNLPFWVVATAIDKLHLKNTGRIAKNPYLIALEFCLESVYQFAEAENQLENLTHIIVESRGKLEDHDLESAFRKISGLYGEKYPFDIKFASKKSNSLGLQIADLVAHPIARHVIKKNQINKAFEMVQKKLLGYPKHEGKGLIFYPLENEVPRPKPRQTADRELPIPL
jgi:hypothetical protein